MPHLDKSGPDHNGRQTGRALGSCNKSAFTDEDSVSKLGQGLSKRRKSGGGKGLGKRLKSGIPARFIEADNCGQSE